MAKPKAVRPKSGNGEGRTAEAPQDRYQMVAEAAYFLAEHRGFEGGDPTDDWLTAEAQIEEVLTASTAEAPKTTRRRASAGRAA